MAYIDTTGSFQPLSLRNVLVQRLKQQSLCTQDHRVAPVGKSLLVGTDAYFDDLTEQAERMLGCVKIMRVFDFAGLVEAMREIDQTWEEDDQQIENFKTEAPAKEDKEIADSEDDASSCSNDDNPRTTTSKEVKTISSRSDIYAGRVGMIIIDTIANVVGSIMSQNQTRGTVFFHCRSNRLQSIVQTLG